MGLFSDKLRKSKELISEFNQQMATNLVREGNTQEKLTINPIDPEKFVDKLVLYGAAADELLRQCTWEDLENCGLPRLLAKKVAKVFRANSV